MAAVVHAPLLRRTYSALRDAGAWCNGAPLRIRQDRVAPLRDCVVATGFAPDPERRAAQISQIARVLAHARDVRCRGAASLELCAVASGEADAYFESDLQPWDVEGGRLIAAEAGADVICDEEHRLLVVARAPNAAALRQLLTDSGEGAG